MSSVQITDTIFFTDDVDPPAIRAFNLGTRQISRVLSYTMETPAIREGISPQHADGYNRTLRPRSMVFVEDSQDRSALYWADAHTHVEKRQALYWPWLRLGCAWAAPGQCLGSAWLRRLGHRCSRAFGATQAGAGAILGVRLDDTPMAIVVSGLGSPEALVAWKPLSGAGAGAGGLRLYWSDVGANRIDTCFLVGTGDTLLKCGEVTALQHWSKRPRGSAPPRLLYLLIASLAALGSTPRDRPAYWEPSHYCLGCSSQPLPKPPRSPPLTMQALRSDVPAVTGLALDPASQVPPAQQ